jgi:hypothetical protein
MFLCAGLQGCGSTLISWCFLQRSDMDGVLDGESDLLPQIAIDFGRPNTWIKTTISSFRISELTSHYQDAGWQVHSLLIVRDVRYVWSSLLTKPYGVNGFSAEDPPLRLRFRRFKEDWELFREKRWPILRYESFVNDSEAVLRKACRDLALSWDAAMLIWPKQASDIADTGRGNKSFWQTMGSNLAETLARFSGRNNEEGQIDGADLTWLENEFHAFNTEYGYPLHLESFVSQGAHIAQETCDFRKTRRYRWELQRKPIRWLLDSIGIPDQSLGQRFLKKAG